MAQNGSLDITDLPKLFAVEDKILSWIELPSNQWQEGVSRNNLNDDLLYLKTALSNQHVLQLLRKPAPEFGKPNADSAKRFENFTAAINLPPSSDKHYNISQIKSDAQWLSKELDLDQIEALRITLLEWQNRPNLHLRAGYSEAEAASLRDVYGSQLAFDTAFELTTLRPRDEDDFSSETGRRRRHVHIYFQEAIGYTSTWLALHNQELATYLGLTNLTNIADGVEQCMDNLYHIIQSYMKGPTWSVIDNDTNDLWLAGQLFYAQSLMQVIICGIREVPSVPESAILNWMTTMADCQFLQSLEPNGLLPPDALKQLHLLISMTTLALIDPANTIAELSSNASPHWTSNFNVITQVHQILVNAVDQNCMQAVPAAFAWALVLRMAERCGEEARHRRESPILQRASDIGTYDSATGRRASMVGSMETSVYEEIISAVKAVSTAQTPSAILLEHTLDTFHVADSLAAMASSFNDEKVLAVRKASLRFLQEVVAAALSELPEDETYGPNTLTPQIAILEPARTMQSTSHGYVEACSTFLAQPMLIENVLDVAATRFPYEALPFLRLCRHLARAAEFDSNGTQYITYRLSKLTTFSSMATGTLSSYHTIREDENLNLVALDDNSFAFPREDRRMLTNSDDQQTCMVIPADTEGVVMSESRPPVIQWQYEYSGLQMIGEWLELRYNGFLYEVLSPQEQHLSSDVATELILLVANLINTTYQGVDDLATRDAAIDFILSETGANLTFGSSVVNLVFDVMEQELQSYRRRPSNTYDTSVLSATVIFAHALLRIRPAQVFQLLSKTSMVSPHGGSSLLYTIIAGVESLSGDAMVTESVCALFEDMITAALQRHSSRSQGKQWRISTANSAMHGNEKIYEVVIASMTKTMLEIYESMPQWRPLLPPQEPKIVVSMSRTFEKILNIHNGVGSSSSRPTSCFESAANLILDRLRPESIGDAQTGAILTHLLDSLQLTEDFLPSVANLSCHEALFDLARSLITVSQALGLSAAGLEHCLLDLAPVLIRYPHRSASRLLRFLLTALSDVKSVSLLGHLGSASSIDLVNRLMAALSSPISEERVSAWRLLDTLINKDQQWLSVVLLTGSVPEKDGKTRPGESSVYRGKPVIDKALDLLSDIQSVASTQPQLVTSVLHFMITAQQNWSWTLHQLRSRQDIFQVLVKYATKTTPDRDPQTSRIIALVTDLSSVHLQYAKSVRNLQVMKVFLPLVNFLTTNAIEVNSYNSSMHSNLSKNFLARFGFALNDFKTNSVLHDELRQFYDLNILDVVLSHDPAWHSDNDQSYRKEVERANHNLQSVESELGLLHSFQRLCIEHAVYFVQDGTIQKTMAHIVQRCLLANTAKYPAEQLFDQLLQTRCDMALALIQRLVEKKVHGSDYRELLKPAWEAVLFANSSYDQAVLNDDIEYWRSSMMVVLLALQFHIKSGWKPLASQSSGDLLKHTQSIVPQVLEIATTVIGHGLNTVVSTLQEQKQAEMQQQSKIEKTDIGIQDLALILNMLETILRMARLPDFVSQLAERLIATGTVQSAIKLYMWSHLLAGPHTDNEPVHAEFAIRLLVSLSSLPAVAEEMAVEGVLNSILTARVTQVLQKIPDGIGNLDQRPHCKILYTIWAEGILPVAVNLLHAVAAPIAADISAFINAFPEQLTRASLGFRPRQEDFLTLSLAKEVASLSLLSFILSDYRTAGASAAVDPTMIIPLSNFDENKKQLETDIEAHISNNGLSVNGRMVATSEKELAWEKHGVLASKALEEMRMAVRCLQDDSMNHDAEDRGRMTESPGR